MDTKKLEEIAKELAKDIKSEKDLSALSTFLVKLTVETALNAEMGKRSTNPIFSVSSSHVIVANFITFKEATKL